MISSFQLYQLVKSLAKEEKRFFTLYNNYQSNQGQKYQYLLLFEALDKTESFKEKNFKIQYKNSPWISNYANLKTYLYKAILDSLAAQHRQLDTHMSLFALMQEWHILRERGLYELALDSLNQAEKIANQADMYFFLPQIAQAKILMKILFFPENSDFEQRKIDIQATTDTTLEIVHNFNLFIQQYLLRYKIFSYDAIQNQNIQPQIQAELSPALQQVSLIQSDKIAIKISLLRNDWFLKKILNKGNDISTMTKIIDLLYQYPDFIKYQQRYFNNALYNAIAEVIRSHNFSLAQEYLQKFDYKSPIFKAQTAGTQREHRHNLLILNLYLAAYSWHFADGIAYFLAEQSWLKKINHHLSQSENILQKYYIGLLFFATNQLEPALEHWDVFFQTPLPIFQFYQKLAQLFRLLALWKMQEWELLLYRFNQTKRWLKKLKEWHGFNKSLGLFIYRSCQNPLTKQQSLQIWQDELRNNPDPTFKKNLNTFDFYRWALLQ
jgi:hypothetical protein